MSYILGLDLGTNSIGWACIDVKGKNINAMGSRIFPEGVKIDKGRETSKNETRRLARQSRCHYARKRQRKEKLTNILKRNGMFPAKKNDEKEFFSMKPYEIRKRGLDEELTLLELGRAFFHLNQRRGFKSSRKSGKGKDDGKVATETAGLKKEIEENSCRTLGEYLAGLDPHEHRQRGRYTLRSMFEEEFDLLWKEQKEFHPKLTEELKNDLKKKTIFHQRPLKSVANLIGACSLEPDKRRCRKDSFIFQRFRILEQVNRLSYHDKDGVEQAMSRSGEKEFDAEIKEKREILIKELNTKEEFKFERIKKLLGLTATFFNLEKSEKKLIGNRTETKYARIFGKEWHSFTEEKKEKIHQVVHGADDGDWLKEYATSKWELSEDKAEKLAFKTSFEPGVASLSTKAIRKLLPFLQEGFTLSEAKERAGYGNMEKAGNLKETFENLKNPIVKQTLYELLGLLHRIEKVHGRPVEVRVELARELKSSAEKRKKIFFENRERKEENANVRKILEEMDVAPTGDALLRYKLWKECKEKCPYTGDNIPVEELFSHASRFQIEHIIPKPRSLDDSYMNKTLCRIDENARKGNKTPYEHYDGTPQYEDILQRIKTLQLPYHKQKRFMQKEINEDFISRHLNDTRYISRMTKTLLKALGYKVGVTQGMATGILRHLWGLNSVLNKNPQGQFIKKNREDNRHHAVDAAVIAVTDATTLRRLSTYNKYDRNATKESFIDPWKDFRRDMEGKIKGMLISHRSNKKVSGPLHKETYYGYRGMKDNKETPLYHVRKELVALTPAMINKIIDPTVKKIVKEHLRSLGVEPNNAKFTIPKNAFKETTLYMKSLKGKKVPIRKVRIHKASNNMISLGKKTGVEPGNNHHVVLYKYEDEKGRTKQGGEICTLFEAVIRKNVGEPVIKRDSGEGCEFLFSLSINEMVLLNTDCEEIDWREPDYERLSPNLFRVQKISGQQIALRHHLAAILKDEDGKEQGIVRLTPSTFNGIKVRVDRIGRIYKAND